MRKKMKKLISKLRGETDVETLKSKGMIVGNNFYKDAKAIIDPSWCWLVTIGNNVTLAPKVHILAHDASTKQELGYTKIGLVNIEDNVFIGANTTILPNVTIGKNSIIGAHSIVTNSIPENSVAMGVPARVVGKTNEYMNKYQTTMQEKGTPIFDESYTIQNKISQEKKQEMKQALIGKVGFVK